MAAWFEEYFGADYGQIVMWSVAALASLVLFLLVYRIVRRMFSGTFVAGGRSRKTRLAILDAAAVDSRRRLVLIRRDDTEHLILIGGPTDVVIEQNIKSTPRASLPEKTSTPTANRVTAEPVKTTPQPAAAEVRAAEPASAPPERPRVSRPESPREPMAETVAAPRVAAGLPSREPYVARPVAATVAAPIPLPTDRPSGATEHSGAESRRYASTADHASSPAPQPPVSGATERGDLDSALLRELEATLDRPKTEKSETTNIDDDMAEMIADMARERV